MQEKKEIKKKKLGSYPVASSEESLLIPAVIPDTQENVYFAKSDIAPTYTKGSNIEIENGIISKRDTKYESGDDVITVTNKPGNVQEISAEDAAGSGYVAGTAVSINDTSDTSIKSISITGLKNSDTSIWQKLQPTYRANNNTKYAGYSNKPIIVSDAFWSESTPDESTAATRITTLDNANGYMTCYNHDWSISKRIIFDRDIKTCNQFFIQQHKLYNIYFDYNFFKTHLNREVYITKSNTQNEGCKVFFVARPGHKLKVIIYTAGTICAGETTDTNTELALMDISYNEWVNGFDATNFNYIRRPVGSSIGFVGKSVWYPSTYSIRASYNEQIGGWYEDPSGTGDEYTLYSPSINTYVPIIERFDYYNKNDERYNYWEKNAKKIGPVDYRLASVPMGQAPIKHGNLYRKATGGFPESNGEYFSSFKFIVLQCVEGGWEEDNILYDLIMLADTRF